MSDRAFVSFNVNEVARVKLTPAGLAERERQTRELNDVIRSRSPRAQLLPVGPYADADGYYIAPIWQLMAEFGPMMHMGAPEVPFVDNRIEIEIKPA